MNEPAPEVQHAHRLARIRAHLPRSNDITLVTLKGHLLVEEAIEEIIKNFCASPDTLEKVTIGFFIKLHMAKALAGPQMAGFAWTLAIALNELRNEFAHRLESARVEQKIDRFIDLARKSGQTVEVEDRAQQVNTGICFLLGSLAQSIVRTQGHAEPGR